MFVSRAAARRRIRRQRLVHFQFDRIAVECEVASKMCEEIDRRVANALLYGTSYPEAYFLTNGDPDDRKA